MNFEQWLKVCANHFGWRSFLKDLKIKWDGPMRLLGQQTYNQYRSQPIKHNQTKHIEINKHFMEEKLEKWIDIWTLCPHMVSYFLPKALVAQFSKLLYLS